MNKSFRWGLAIAIVLMLTVVPCIYFRLVFAREKRLREVTPGVFYRSGQMTADGFTEAITGYHIRTVINVQNEYPDPDVASSYLSFGTVKESELCRRLGVKYVFLPCELIARRQIPEHRPETIDRFLEILDDPANRPALLHCKAGLHRTGVLTAVYRMEYQGWHPDEAIRELKANGFGEFVCSSANDYIIQYILTYKPRK